jgi:hypothetical protein
VRAPGVEPRADSPHAPFGDLMQAGFTAFAEAWYSENR